MGAVADFVSDVVGGAVEWVGDTISDVVSTVGDVIEGALSDPLGTIANIAAIATGQYWALPIIAGVNTAVKGGDLMDVFKSVAISAIAQKAAPYIGEKTQGVLSPTVGKTAANIIASGTASASVAILTGADPLKSFISGGISAGASAILGKIEESMPGSIKNMPKGSVEVIKAAVEAQLSGGDVTSAVIGTALRTSTYVTKALNDLGVKDSIDPVTGKPTGVSSLSPANQAVLADILYNTATAAMAGTDASDVVQASLMRAGSRALGKIAGDQFDKITGRVTEVYNEITGQVELISTNEASQKAIVAKYNATKASLDGDLAKLNTLETDAQAKINAFNADRTSQANLDAANAAIEAYNNYAAEVNTKFTNTYKPEFDKYSAQLDALKVVHQDLTKKYEDLDLSFNKATGDLDLVVDEVSKVVNETVTTTMDPSFNANEYAIINGLDSSVDPYNHWLIQGKNKGLYTNFTAASADIDAKQADLMQSVAKSMGLDINQISSKDFAALHKAVTDRYGNNLAALSTAKASDITGNLTKEQLFADSAKSGFKGDLNTTVYGDWNKPANLTLPPGVKLASKEAYIAGIAKQGVDANGNIYSYVPDESTAPNVWSNTNGTMSIKLDPVYITDGAPGVSSAVQRAFTLAEFPNAQNKIDQISIDAAKNLVNKAKATNNYNSITDTTMDAAIKTETLKKDITSILDFGTANGVKVDGPNTALFGGTPGMGAGTPVTTLGPMSNRYSLLGYGGTFFVKDLTNDRVYSILNVGDSTVLRDASTNIEVTLTPDQAKVLKGQIAGGTAGNLDTVPGATDVAKMAAGLSATNGKTVAENTTAINNQINAGTTTLEEAKAMLNAAGYTNPTDAEAQQFASIRNTEAAAKTQIEAFADPLVSTTDEVKEFFVNIGYNPTDKEVAKFVGKIAEAKNKTDIGTYTDPLMVDSTEVADAFKAMGIKYPDPSDVQKFVGQYNESLLQSKIDPNKQDIQFRSLQYQLDNVANSKEALADTEKRITEKIGSRYTGPTAADVTAINNIIASGTGGTGAQDLKYDYNGDGKVDNTDLSAIQGYLSGVGGVGGTGTGEVGGTGTGGVGGTGTGGVGGGIGTGTGTGFAPGAGTIWDAPTGIYKTIADEAAAAKAANEAAAKATQDKIAASNLAIATQAKQNQQVTNTNQLLSWLSQADDAGGQKVTVNQSPLTQINNVYDWSSIFATPQQQKMFITPYAEGGSVDDLVKILKG